MMGFWQIIGAGWRGAFGAARANWGLFTVAALVLIVAGAPMNFMSQHMVSGFAFTGQLDRAGTLKNPFAIFDVLRPYWWIFSLITIMQMLLMAFMVTPCMVAVHRFILCDQYHVAFNSWSRLRLFAGLLLLIRLVSSLFFLVPIFLLGAWGVVVQVILAIACFVFALLCVRFLLAFPAIALDIPDPINDSWVRTRGHWSYIVGIFFVGGLSLSLSFLLVSIILEIVSLILHEDWISSTIYNGLFLFCSPILGAGFASELYRKYGGFIKPTMS